MYMCLLLIRIIRMQFFSVIFLLYTLCLFGGHDFKGSMNLYAWSIV